MGAVQNKESGSAWWMAGALTALAVVLRETFAPFALFGLVSVFIAQGRKAALRFFIGGVVTGSVLIGGILIARGGVVETIASYRVAGIVFDLVSGDLHLNFTRYGLTAIHLSSIVMTFSALAAMGLLVAIFFRRDRSLLLAAIFWLSFIVVALIEAATKVCYAYHFATALPGFAGLCALALREIIQIWPAMKWVNGRIKNILAMVGIVLSTIWLYFSCSTLAISYWSITRETLVAAPSGEWPEKFTNQSAYLFAAAEIKKVIPRNGTLSISGSIQIVYPLTGHLPPTYRMSELSIPAILLNFSVPSIRQTLLDCAPDVLMITTKDWPMGSSMNLLEAVLATGIYEAKTKILAGAQNADLFGGMTIFRKTKESVCLEKQGMAEWIRHDATSSDTARQILHPSGP
jgi:hypothetical protein